MVVAHCLRKTSPALANLCASSDSALVLPRQCRKTPRWIYCRRGCLLANAFRASTGPTTVYVPISADWDKASAADAADAFYLKK
jgi:hypothetical protein